MNQRIIGNLLLVLGSIGVVLFGGIFLILALMVIFPAPQTRQDAFVGAAVLITLFSPLGIIGAVLMFIGLFLRRRGRRLEAIRANVMSHERVEINWLSNQMGLDVTRTRKLLFGAISRGLVRGEFATENLFISAMEPSDIRMAAAPNGGSGHQVLASGSGETSPSRPTRDPYSAGSMDSITYSPTQASSFVTLAFTGIGIVFVVVGLLFTILLLFVFPPLALVFLLFPLFGLAFAAFGGWRWYSSRQQRLQLTPQALVSFSRGKRFQLQLTDIRGISAREGVYWAKDPLSSIDMETQHRYWIVRIQTNAGNYLDLDVSQDGYIGLFDVARVLRDLLPRVPAMAQIDPRIQNYVATGRMT